MKKQVFFGTLALLASQAFAQQAAVTGPDSRLKDWGRLGTVLAAH